MDEDYLIISIIIIIMIFSVATIIILMEWKESKLILEENTLYFINKKWTEKCSDFPFTSKPSCKWLCIQDCMIINKQAGEVRCVC